MRGVDDAVAADMPGGMIDLHCHMLPAIDDGSLNLAMSLEMAQIAADDGIGTIACTPHIYPGMYANTAAGIKAAVAAFQAELDQRAIPLHLTYGADTHLCPDLLERLADGTIPTLAGSRYLLLEPPHHVAPPRFEETVFRLRTAGYVSVITHPERLTWLGDHYALFQRLFHAGTWMQITAGSLTGRFGSAPKYWAERMLDDGMVHLLATDAHRPHGRSPHLAEGRDAAARWVGDAEALRLVTVRPRAILDNATPAAVPAPPAPQVQPRRQGFLQSLFSRA